MFKDVLIHYNLIAGAILQTMAIVALIVTGYLVFSVGQSLTTPDPTPTEQTYDCGGVQIPVSEPCQEDFRY